MNNKNKVSINLYVRETQDNKYYMREVVTFANGFDETRTISPDESGLERRAVELLSDYAGKPDVELLFEPRDIEGLRQPDHFYHAIMYKALANAYQGSSGLADRTN